MSDAVEAQQSQQDTAVLNYQELVRTSIAQLCDANRSSLKSIFTSAPTELQNQHLPIPRRVYKLLGIVLGWRETLLLENRDELQTTELDRNRLDQMFSMSLEEVEQLSIRKPGELIEIIEGCLRADPNLTPRTYDKDNHTSLSQIVLKWHLLATKEALKRRDSGNECTSMGVRKLQDKPPPPGKRRNPLSESGSRDVEMKRAKVNRIGGVPTGDHDENSQDFWPRLGGPTPLRPSQLKEYPGKTSVLLNVQELMGPSILHSVCQEGVNVELVVRNVRWTRQSDGRPFSSKVEALTLARRLARNSPSTTLGTSRGADVDIGTQSSLPRGGMAPSASVIGNVSGRWHTSASNAFNCTPTGLSSFESQERSPEHYQETPVTEAEYEKATRARNKRLVLDPRVRLRTFPLSSVLKKNASAEGDAGTVSYASEALDFLYLGRNIAKLPAHSDRSVTLRAVRSLITRHIELGRDIGQDCVKEITRTQRDFLLQTAATSCSAPHQDVLSFVEDMKASGLIRGDFKLLNSNRLDLPAPSQSHANLWIKRMPLSLQNLFTESGFSNLISEVRSFLGSDNERPPSRVHAHAGEYPLLLSRLEDSGMLRWSVVDNEDKRYTTLADALTMTSFAVVKDISKDRLISWPRIQNLCMPEPPEVNLPNPGHLAALQVPKQSILSGFYLDIANMFHNIRMPSNLASIFPFAKVAFGNLPGCLQRKLQAKFGFRPEQSELLRPLQCTLPMGFKWSVFIGHTFVESCYQEAFVLFRPSSRRFRLSNVFDLPVLLHRTSGPDWSQDEVAALQDTIEKVLTNNYLPVKRSKSSPVGVVETVEMPFIGWVWYLKRGVIRPKAEKLQLVAKEAAVVNHMPLDEVRVRSLVGRIVWIALGLRPLLSVLYRTFQYLQAPNELSNELEASVKREICMICRLLPFSHIRLTRGFWHRIIAFDASPVAGAVVYTDVDVQELQLLLQRLSGKFRDPTDCKTIVQFVCSRKWTTAFVHRWRRQEHINALEAHTAVLALEWAASFNVTGLRMLVLSDSMVTIGALQKGRSSSHLLCLLCRRFTAISVSHDLEPLLAHVPSDYNPADGSSRPGPRVGSQ
ncbi:hypothetical protein FGB62_177g010 [Gracilaria domingensis]|nr:hypothetical protein FGB62_177g010 [Gracilaria domingensis]